jgi:hypothetical protein
MRAIGSGHAALRSTANLAGGVMMSSASPWRQASMIGRGARFRYEGDTRQFR